MPKRSSTSDLEMLQNVSRNKETKRLHGGYQNHQKLLHSTFPTQIVVEEKTNVNRGTKYLVLLQPAHHHLKSVIILLFIIFFYIFLLFYLLLTNE